MNAYSFVKPILFQLDPELAHSLTKNFLSNHFLSSVTSLFFPQPISKPTSAFGLTFENPVGLAAGLDKNAEMVDSLAQMGFGFVEIGTVTPKPQEGNPKPRLFRLKADDAIINRMGFNNVGVYQVAKNLERRKSPIIIGGNIGKNKITPNTEAIADYEICLHTLHDLVDYFVINVSSPNTPGLRELQERSFLTELFTRLENINQQKSKPKPILLKIAPDLNTDQLNEIITVANELNLKGMVATNTTIERQKLPHYLPSEIEAYGAGGLSGKPLTALSTSIVSKLKSKLNEDCKIIGAGGIMSKEDAKEKWEAGASLIQLYSGFIYKGPALISEILQ